MTILDTFQSKSWIDLISLNTFSDMKSFEKEIIDAIEFCKLSFQNVKLQEFGWSQFVDFKRNYLFLGFIESFLGWVDEIYYLKEEKIKVAKYLAEKINNEFDLLHNDKEIIKKFQQLVKNTNVKSQKIIINQWLEEYFKVNITEENKLNIQKIQKSLRADVDKFIENNERSYWHQTSMFKVPTEKLASLDGLAKRAINIGIANGKLNDFDGAIFYLNEQTAYTLLKSIKNRDIRKKVYEKYVNLNGENYSVGNNSEILKNFIRNKQKIAKIFNEDNYTNLLVKDFVLNNKKSIFQYFYNIESQLVPLHKNIEIALKNLAVKNGIREIKAWDHDFLYDKLYSNEMLKNTNSFKNYFEYNNVISKIFKFFEKQFNFKITKTRTEKSKGDVDFYEFRDLKTNKNYHIVLRATGINETSSPCQLKLVDKSYLSGKTPVEQIQVVNFTLDADALKKGLDFYDLDVVLHELGHVMHMIFTSDNDGVFEKGYSFDLIELPSQFLSHLLYDYNFIKYLSSHRISKKKISHREVFQVIQNKMFFDGYDIYKNIQKYKAQIELFSSFKPYSKQNPHEVMNMMMAQNRIMYNIAQDGHMCSSDYKFDYCAVNHVYLFADMLAFELFKCYKINDGMQQNGALRNIYEKIFNVQDGQKLTHNIQKYIDLDSINVLEYLKKTWDIEIFGERIKQNKMNLIQKVMFEDN